MPDRRAGLLLAALLSCMFLGLGASGASASPREAGEAGPAGLDALGLESPSGRSDSAASDLPFAVPEAGGYRLARVYQSSPDVPLGVLEDPAGLTVASDGTVFVTDRELNRAQRFEADGTPILAYGKPGDGPGELFGPSGIAVDIQRDRVYIGDTENDRVAIFHLDGSFEANWGPYEAPEGIAVGRNGRVYIYEGDTGGIRIRESDGTGDLLVTPGRYMERESGIASGLTIGPDGNLYVAMNLGVRMYDADGIIIGNGAPKLYSTGSPITRDVTFDARGRIYVLERDRLRYEWTGGIALPVSVPRRIRAIAGGPSGSLYLLVPKTRDLPAGVEVRTFTNGRQTEVLRWGIPQTVLGWLNQPLRLALGERDDLYVVDDLRRVQRFGKDLTQAYGQMVLPGLTEVVPLDDRSFVVARTRFGSSEDDPEDPDVAPPGMQAARVERYDLPSELGIEPPPQRSLVPIWQHETVDDITAADASRVLGVTRGHDGELAWVIDAGKALLRGFGVRGKQTDGVSVPDIQANLTLPNVQAGFPAWSDVASAPDGRIYALHTAERRLYRFGADGSAEGYLEVPEWSWRIALGPAGEIFLPTARRWVWRLDAEGRPTALWPLPPPAYGDPQPPSDVAVGSDGTVYILDQSSSAIYAFEAEADRPADGRPAPGRLRCQIEVTGQAAPREAELNQPVTIDLRLAGQCPPHLRTGDRPSKLLRSGTLSVTLSADVELIAGSVEPPARIEGRSLIWDLGEIDPAGMGLRYRVTATKPGRWQALEAGGFEFLDGWFDFGGGRVGPVDFFALIPATPEPPPRPTRVPLQPLWLPWLGGG